MNTENAASAARVEPVVMRGLIVRLEEGVYLAPWSGDPGRTLDRNAARTFTSGREARKAIAWARRFRPFEHAKIESRQQAFVAINADNEQAACDRWIRRRQ